LVYHSENPRALKGYCKKELPVVWRSNKKAWITGAVFESCLFHFKIEILVIFSLSNYTYSYVMHVKINSLYAFSSYAMISQNELIA
jgi:hypothetical protein